MVIEGLRAIQREHGYLPTEALSALAQRINVPLYQVQGVASFYPHFRLAPPPMVDVRVCNDMSCHLRGAGALLRAAEERVARLPGTSLGHVSCLGRCDRAPAAVVNDVILAGMTPEKLGDLVASVAAGAAVSHHDATPPPVSLRVDPYADGRRYEAVRAFVETRDVAGLLRTLRASDLRGLGGAGFPTGTKWEIVRTAVGSPKYVVCNADESEPGTIKDRFILDHVPHLVIEGMILAGLVVGAHEGIIYIRHEYEAQAERLERELAACRREGLLGANVLGSGLTFDARVFVSPGGYICGEESALLEAIEDKRAEPRNKPPFPGTHGLWQKPTVINNVETFACVPLILVKGVEWFKAQGANGASGLKFIGVSGHVARPGVYEVAMGTTIREVIDHHAGGMLRAARSRRSPPRVHRRGTSRRRWSTSHSTSPPCRKPARCSGRGRSSCAPKEPACSTWRSTVSGSSATNRAASACRAAWAAPSWWTSSSEPPAVAVRRGTTT